jgi:hypothetical protein
MTRIAMLRTGSAPMEVVMSPVRVFVEALRLGGGRDLQFYDTNSPAEL